jgi:hypothetical protein
LRVTFVDQQGAAQNLNHAHPGLLGKAIGYREPILGALRREFHLHELVIEKGVLELRQQGARGAVLSYLDERNEGVSA